MDGVKFAEIIEVELKRQGKSKGEFYNAVGVSPTALYGWKNGSIPKRETVAAVSEYLGLDLTTLEQTDPRENLRDDLRILLNSASDLPPSSVYALISQIEKMKEDAT